MKRRTPSDASEDGSETDGHKRGDVSQKEAQKRRLQQIATACSTLHNLLQARGVNVKNERAAILQAAVSFIEGSSSHGDGSSVIGVPLAPSPSTLRLPVADISLLDIDCVVPSGCIPGSDFFQSRLTDAGAMFIHGGCAQGILDLRGNLLDCNRVNTLLFGASKEELMTRGIFSSVPAEQLPQAYQGWAAMLSTPPSVSQLPKARWAVQTSKYGTLAVDVVTTIVRDPEGKPQYLLCSVMPAGSDGDEPEDEACVRDSQRRRLTLPEEELASDAGVGVGGGVGDVMLPPSTSQTQRAEVVPDGDGDAANLDLLAGFDVCGDTAFAPLPPVVPLSPLTPLVDEIANGCQQPPRRNGVSYAAASVTTAASVVPASSVALESFDSLCRLSGDFPSCAALALASPSQSSVAADAMPDDELWHSLGCVDDLMPAGIQ